jgi:hypothetical protein
MKDALGFRATGRKILYMKIDRLRPKYWCF